MNIGQRIRLARERFKKPKMSRAVLAKRLGVTGETVRAWECDGAEPKSDRHTQIARELKVRKPWLVLGIEPMEPSGTESSEVMDNQILDGLAGLPDEIRATLFDLASQIRKHLTR